MNADELKTQLREAVEELESSKVRFLLRRALLSGISPNDIVCGPMVEAMKTISDRFDCGEIFLPQLLVATDCFDQAIEYLRYTTKEKLSPKGTVLVYTVEGDIHDIGKNIVSAVLRANGLHIVDLGRNVRAEKVVEEAERIKPQVIIAFALMATTVPLQRELPELLTAMGMRDRYRILVGGQDSRREWAKVIGADGYAVTVSEAVTEVFRLIES